MEKKKRKTYNTLTIFIVLSYIVYGILWFHAAYEGSESVTSTEITIRNICEVATYVLFLICSMQVWDHNVEKKYSRYLISMNKVILFILGAGIIFTVIHYLILGTFWSNYLTPVAALILIMYSVLLLLLGMQAKKDVR